MIPSACDVTNLASPDASRLPARCCWPRAAITVAPKRPIMLLDAVPSTPAYRAIAFEIADVVELPRSDVSAAMLEFKIAFWPAPPTALAIFVSAFDGC